MTSGCVSRTEATVPSVEPLSTRITDASWRGSERASSARRSRDATTTVMRPGGGGGVGAAPPPAGAPGTSSGLVTDGDLPHVVAHRHDPADGSCPRMSPGSMNGARGR